ncbi:exopolysaccharide biosynthesis polyprenyl glycosylphosphotransferase [Pelagibacterium nitratireducens]|uniref:Exopolysaccharide biosynthesis polyprenyl glycosylphosphotransferase n=1 Tax=Pelagibacterium nitratireducens TaxID=1046114 RepID=A0ABZ2I1X9_9HYPH
MLEFAKERVHARSEAYDYSKAEAGPYVLPVGREPTPSMGSRVSLHSGLPLTFMNGEPAPVSPTPMRRMQLVLKRIMDIAFSAITLLMFAPALLMIALAIRLTSGGPALFRQRREGLDGKPIEIYKFRSMYMDRCDISGVAQTTSDDPRITPIGRFLRRTSLDELPQLLNILKGEMSLIGPRPHAFGMLAGGTTYKELVPYYRARQTMKPGLSGWAQANGLRGPTDNGARARARIDHDLAYIENFSLLLDIKIILKTLRQEFLGGSGL